MNKGTEVMFNKNDKTKLHIQKNGTGDIEGTPSICNYEKTFKNEFRQDYFKRPC